MTSPNELPPLTELTPLPEILERNALLYGSDVSLVELSPETENARLVTWKDFELIEPPSNPVGLRRSTTWKKFNELANRFANLLLSRGLKKGDKVAILLLNCLEWLPIYFGALKAGAVAVPLNFPLRRGRNQILPRAFRGELPCLWLGIHRTTRVDLRRTHEREVALLRRRKLPHLRGAPS